MIGDVIEYEEQCSGLRLAGLLNSAATFGIKAGGGVGAAMVGWLLAWGGFDGKAAVQSASAVNVIFFMYAVIPVIFGLIMAVLIYLLKVEDANREWDRKHLEGENV